MRVKNGFIGGLAAVAAIGAAAPASAGAAINEAPVITAPSKAWTEARRTHRFDGAISVADADAGSGELAVRLTMDYSTGWFHLPEAGGLTFTIGNAESSSQQVAFRGTLAAVNAALAELEFTPPAHQLGGRTPFRIDVDDLGNSGDGGPRTANATVDFFVGRSGPLISYDWETAPRTPMNTPYVSDGRLFAIDDAQDDEMDVRITVSNATIALGAAPDADVVDAGGDGDARVIGTPQEVAPALDGIVVTPAQDFLGRILVRVTATDQDGSSGSTLRLDVGDEDPPAREDPDEEPGEPTGVLNAAPTITAPREIWLDRGVAHRFAGAISIADADAGDRELSVRLTSDPSWGGGFNLRETTGLTFTQGNGQADAQVKFRGTLTALNAALAQLEYREDGYWVAGHGVLQIEVSDRGNSGDGGPRIATAEVGFSVGEAGPVVTLPWGNPPHTPKNTPYVSNGALFWVEDKPDRVLDVRIDVRNARIALGAAPDADVVDPGGDGDARVVGTSAQIAPALHGVVVTPDQDFVGVVRGELIATQGRAARGGSFNLIVDDVVTGPPTREPGGDDGLQGRDQQERVVDAQPQVVQPRRPDDQQVVAPAQRARAASGPVARASVRRSRGFVVLNGRRSSARGKRIRSYRWTARNGRVLSRKASLRLRVSRLTRVTLTVVDSTGAKARTSVLLRPQAQQSRRAKG